MVGAGVVVGLVVGRSEVLIGVLGVVIVNCGLVVFGVVRGVHTDVP